MSVLENAKIRRPGNIGWPRYVAVFRLDFVLASSGRIHERVRLLRTGNAHFFRIPFEESARKALRDAPEQKGFRHRALGLKIGNGRRTAFTSREPLIDRQIAWMFISPSGRRSFVFRRFRIDMRVVAVEAGKQKSVVSGIHNALAVLAAFE